MRAEKTAQKISRSYLRYLRKMDELIVSMDRAQMLLEAREEGMEEKAEQIARKMKTGGEPLTKIIDFTGLSTETIQRL